MLFACGCSFLDEGCNTLEKHKEAPKLENFWEVQKGGYSPAWDHTLGKAAVTVIVGSTR